MTAAPLANVYEQNTSQLLDVLIIGAGFGGVGAAIKLLQQGISNFRIIDKAAGVGGTWWHNTYPGAACDIPSHLYCYSFEPNPNWSRVYSSQVEIQQYIEHCVDKYSVRPYLRLNSEVTAFRFVEQQGYWSGKLTDGSSVNARHVISATGGLHQPAYPRLPGVSDFVGPAMHSAEWDHTVNFQHKRVAVIGSAASAIQLIPELAKVARQLDVYQRTPNYIAPRKDRAYSVREKARLARWPWLNRLYRQALFLRGEFVLFPLIKSKQESRWRSRVENMIKGHIASAVTDAVQHKALIPAYPLGCKRILISDDFLQTLNRDNVALHTKGIERIVAEGVITSDSKQQPADIIVYATGFDVDNYYGRIKVTGPHGKTLSEEWQDIPSAYKGFCVPGFPNFYFTTGPNTGVGTTSVVYMIEAQLELILQSIKTAGANTLLSVKPEANVAYNRKIQAALAGTVWSGNCQSWYKRADGRIATLYPFNARSYRKDHKKLQLQDFELQEIKSAAVDGSHE